MSENKSVISINDYGRIKLHLSELMKEKGIKRNTLAKAVNTRFEVIDKWCKNKVEKLDMDILARICFVLDCKVSDIIEYEEKI